MTKFELPEKPKKTNTSEDFNNLRTAVDELDKFDYAWKTYANKAERRINAANKYIEELERENQRLVAENFAVKTLVDSARPQQALPVVPECVAEFIDDAKGNLSLYGALSSISDNKNNELNNWVFREAHQNLFVRAWLDGYTVEKPQLFEVKMPIVYWDDDASQLTNGFEFLRIDKETDEVDFIGFLSNTKKHTVYFTEQEIKSIDERYWQFAVPVEDNK